MIYKTERLLLLPMSHFYKNELDKLHADPDVMQQVGGPYSEEKSHKKIRESEEHWLRHGFGLWCLFENNTKEFLGRGGLRYQTLDNGCKIIELAYMLHKKYWGKGYATELARYSIHIGLKQWNFPEIIILTTAPNIRSQKVVNNMGIQFEKSPVLFRGVEHKIAHITHQNY